MIVQFLKKISKRFKKAKELGVKFVPATGRGYNTVDGTLKELVFMT